MKKRILAVDDDPMNREIIAEILGDEFDVHFACNGREALDRAAESKPDLVVLDIMMPELDGYETCERLKARDPYLKVLLVSAKALPSERLRGYQVGADDYVTKPFDPYEFLAKIRVFLRLSFAEEVGQMKSTLITLLAHETRTPLAHILSSAQLLEDERTFESREERNDLLGIILSGAQRLQTIFEKSMFLFQQQSGTIALERTRLELGAVVRSEIDRVRTRVSGVTLEYEGSEEIAIEGQEPLLRQALGILLEQAARRSPSNAPVRVRVESQEQGAAITVSDAGVSPEAESLAHYFEIFHVSDIAHHSDALDLDRPICASIVRRHGGSIRATIPEEGGLSCLVVLPSEEDAKQVA
ncbi:MAG: response regulator [Candidatus Eisenbacteria bacterium]|uniref:Response regulator n=1 Tax=Eiseniibacteriota bacterium TaxID=2212470 RepID=A0A956NE30_UNCEI|nr:response regulator [Candidatus Eisenbacteria bacterium]MCB9465809.1 response regulator [Candidatus Eisenbacteria bacterium]